MCGRFALTATREELEAVFSARLEGFFGIRFNIAPASPVLAVHRNEGVRGFLHARWGLWPSWVKDPATFSQLINARIETVLEKPSFKAAIRHRRWLVPVSGFYEWKREGESRQSFYAQARAHRISALAAIGETWTGPDGEEVDTLALLTQPAVGAVAAIHHRQPVIVAPEHFGSWLDCAGVPAAQALDLVSLPTADYWQAHPVSGAVNNARNDTPDLMTPIDPAPEVAPTQKSEATDQLSLF